MGIERKEAAGLPYREALPGGDASGPAVVLVHGFPESSRMWMPAMQALADAGRHSVAPDLYCLGDSTDPGPATFERNLGALGAFIEGLGLGRVALVVHDWGGFIGLAWACEHPDQVAALVISDTGFFADGKWHGMAEAARSEQGEGLVAALERDGFAALLRADGATFSDEDIDSYWRPFVGGRGREATLEFYRSMDFEKLEPYQGKLGGLGVPTLLLWGADDQFAPLAGAHRFQREIPGAELVAIEGAGHFVFETEPERCATEIARFLASD
jgi:pimeloyl-ACP methyl ester carboxylesterase